MKLGCNSRLRYYCHHYNREHRGDGSRDSVVLSEAHLYSNLTTSGSIMVQVISSTRVILGERGAAGDLRAFEDLRAADREARDWA